MIIDEFGDVFSFLILAAVPGGEALRVLAIKERLLIIKGSL